MQLLKGKFKTLSGFFQICLVLWTSISTVAQVPSSYQVGRWQKFKSAAVTYTFDDNTSNQIPVALPIFNQYNFKTTLFVVTGWGPNWTQHNAASVAGHEVTSHSQSHTTLTTLSTTQQDAEYKNSQTSIRTNIPSAKSLTIAYPNCNTGDIPTLQKYFIAGRTCSGQINSSSPTDFFNLSSIICGSTGVNTAADMNARISSARTTNGWCVFLMHGIDNDGGYSPLASTVLSSHLSFVNTNIADYWVATFADVAKYIKERNALNITETSVTGDSIRLTPTDNLDNSIYDIAITVRRQLPTGWTNAKVYQGNTLQTSSIVTVNSVKYIEFEVVPDKGVYALASTSVSNCSTPAPTVTSPVSYTKGATASPLSATGTALKWYTVATSGTASATAPTPSTSTVGTTTYYVSQTLNNCESPRAAITINVTATSGGDNCVEPGEGAYHTGIYRNMFKELLNKTDAEVNTKVDNAFQQIFYGSSTQKLYYEVGSDMAYILDVNNNDVRSEGMSYGMMICAQLNKQAEFDKLWKWTKTYMQYGANSNYNGYFAWQLNTDGSIKGNSPASDGEAYFITSLFFAANRWGNGTGIYNYEAEAQDILNKVMSKTGAGSVYNLFNTNSKLITFVPYGDSYGFTDPSYNLPGFWELWARWSKTNTNFWAQTPEASRKLLRDASHPTSGLTADYSEFDGTPKEVSYNVDADRFMYDAWRTIMNIGMDYHWFKADTQQAAIAERYLTFFKNQGASYLNHYDWNGSNPTGDHSTGLVACNAVASLAVNNPALTTPFVQEFWNISIPTGTYRYYDGMLYMLALLNVSGNFKVYKPDCGSTCTTPAPVVSGSLTYEQDELATALTATGTALKWYTEATGGIAMTAAPVPNTSVTGTVTYYVSQTLNECEGPRESIQVTVIKTHKIFKTTVAPILDGTIDEVWNDPQVLPLNANKIVTGTVTNAIDLSGSAKYLWDNNYIYVLATITDDSKQNDSPNSYEDDAVEFYFDVNNDKSSTYGTNDVQYSFGWNDGTIVGSLPAGRSIDGITYSSISTTNGYIIEARIPWSTLQETPAVAKKIGIDFMINDDDDGAGRDGKLSWNAAEDNAWQDASLFGTAVLADVLITATSQAKHLEINIFPNPVTASFQVRGLSDSFTYSIVDNSGRPLLSGNSDGLIDIQKLEPGIYGVIIYQGQNKNVVKLVVNK